MKHAKRTCWLLAALVCASCGHHAAQEETAVFVKTDTVRLYRQNLEATFPGKVKAASDLDLAFKVSGTLQRIPVRQGSFVRKGGLLAEMDDRDYRTQLNATEAEYQQIKNEASRVIELYEKQSASRSDYDKAVYGLQQIEAKYEAHRHALEDTKIYAPFDCYVEKVYFDAFETVSAGLPVVAVINAGMPEVEINIPSADYLRRDLFESFSCRITLYPDKVYPLELAGISHKANLNQLYTTTLVMLPNEHSMQLPTPGMSAMVTITYRQEDHQPVQVPVSAVFTDGGASKVWVYRDGTVTAAAVTVEMMLDDGTVILDSGVEPGSLVVTAGAHTLKEGQQVRLLPPVTETNKGGML